jgi:hypothetical protein
MKASLLKILETFSPEDWKRGIAMVILWAYAYQLLIWPAWFNIITLLNQLYGLSLPAPVLIPWEQMLAGTTTLGTIGGIQAWRDKNTPPDAGVVPQ